MSTEERTNPEIKQENTSFDHVEDVPSSSEALESSNNNEKTNLRVDGGLRVEGDGFDHSHYNSGSIWFKMTILGCSFALAGSQIPPLLYLTLGTKIAYELGRPDLKIWLFTAIVVAQGAFSPFVGPMADMLGRKKILLAGFVASIVGSIVCAATPDAPGFLAGQVLLGIGTIVQELMAIAIVGECVPTSKRPIYAALVLCSIIPWSPGTLYANWLTEVSWRYIGVLLAVWNVINMAIIAFFYRPPPRFNSLGLTKRQMLKRLDYVGGFLITVGMVFFLIALNSGGISHPWSSGHVLGFFITGILLMIAFGFWQWKGTKYPMYPRRIIHAPRQFFCMMFVIFAAGINYVPLVVFWPVESISVFNAGGLQQGINTLPIGMCILAGAIFSAILIGIFKKRITWIMTTFCVIQTIGCACLVLIKKDNIDTAWAPVVLALIGVGGVLVPNQVVLTIITPDDLIASITALSVGLRAQAQTMGLAIFYNRLTYEVTKNTYKYVVPAMLEIGYVDPLQIEDMMNALTGEPFYEYAQNIPQLALPENLMAHEIVRDATATAFIHGFEHIYLITIAFGVTACIASAFLGDVSKYMDHHVAVVL